MPRVILLGASNVTLSIPRLWHGLCACSEPLELFAAHGHGRSYGQWSHVGPRALPGIVRCRLWDDLAVLAPTTDRPRALITDIGNDILYGVESDQIAAWIEVCLKRLTAMSARIVMTQLPIASASSLSRSRFLFFRHLFFPESDLRFEDLESRIARLNQRIVELGREHEVPTPELRGEWYGLDPIHIRRRFRLAAWRELLATWFDSPNKAAFDGVGVGSALRLWRQRPFERRWFGRTQHAAQPVLREPDGSALWLY